MRRAIVVVALCVAAIGGGAQSASAAPATRYVAPGGSDSANDCTDSSAPCAAIQHAVAEAAAGDTIAVEGGTYPEEVTIDKALDLVGDSAPAVEGGAGPAIAVKSGGVSISGFALSNSGIGIELAAEGKEVSIEDNEFSASLDEYAVLGDAGKTVEGFQMDGNRLSAPSRIATKLEAKDPSAENEIARNTFESASGPQLEIVGNDVRLVENSFQGQGTAGCLEILGEEGVRPPAEDVLVSGSTFEDCDPFGVALGPKVDGITIRDSEFPGSYDAILVGDEAVWDVTGHVEVLTNRIVGTTHLGVDNQVSGTLDAEQNWWGCNGGPGAAGCDAVSAGVDTAGNAILAGLVGPLQEGSSKLPSGNSIALSPGERAEVAAFLLVNGLGVDNGIPSESVDVSFSSTLGSFAPPFATPLDGLAKSTFTAGATPGTGSIVLGMDNAQTDIPLTIRGGSAETPPPPQAETPPGPRITAISRRVLVSGPRASVGLVSCALSCRVTPGKATIAIGGHRYSGKVTPRGRLGAESTKPIRVALPPAAQRALKSGKKGRIRVTVGVTDTAGRKAKRALSVKISG